MVNRIAQYLTRHARLDAWPMTAASTDGVEQAVVIPALAERRDLFQTLRSLAANPAEDLDRTLVLCVVNNREDARPDQKKDNAETIAILRDCIEGRFPPELTGLNCARLRLAYVDATTPGRELPRGEGVGLARKIGMDWAVRVLSGNDARLPVVLCLDADTRVEANYLRAVRDHYGRRNAWGAVVAYEHRAEPGENLPAEAALYELFLRYYALGLSHARSPYAYHAIGSTMTCRIEAYAAVSGMNRRLAGEDFYFLQKLAKTGGVSFINTTAVYPSHRASDRVPFGTGRALERIGDPNASAYTVYDPESFRVLGEWLDIIRNDPFMPPDAIGEAAHAIAPALQGYLDEAGFAAAWRKIQRNHPDSMRLLEQFHCWFDAFRTMKLIHFLRGHGYPQIPIDEAVSRLLTMVGCGSVSADAAGLGGWCGQATRTLNYLREQAREAPDPVPIRRR